MKGFLKKRWHGIPMGIVSAVLLLCLLTGSAFAIAPAFTLPIPSTVAVTADTAVEVYSDATCTTSLTNIAWGNIGRGANATQAVYVKYVGDAGGAAMTVEAVGLPDEVSLTWLPGEEFDFDGTYGEVAELTLTLSVDPHASIGPISFSINFNTDPLPPLP